MRLLFLDIDTLRPDHLGCYGYHRNTSPNIDRIAANGTVFTNYYCSDAPCLPSRAALMTGRTGIHTGVISHGGTAADLRLHGEGRGFKDPDSLHQLPFVCRDAGMHTACYSPFAERHSSYWFYTGFNEVMNTGKCGQERAEEIIPLAIDWINRKGKEDNWYLHVNIWDPHTPYRTPDEYGNPFKNDPLPEWITEEVFEEHKKLTGSHTPAEICAFGTPQDVKHPLYPNEIHDMDGVRKMFDGYDTGIKYADDHVGMVLKALEENGILEDTTIIVSADHGENMGEWGIYGEHATADNGTCRIPLIFSTPNGYKGYSDGLHTNIDLVPTLADMLGVAPYEKWDGSSYKDTVLEGKDTGHDDIIISQCAHGCQRSVRFGDYLYVRTYQDAYRMLKDELLYNLAEDPFQQHDLSEEMPEKLHEGAHRLMLWHDNMMKTSSSQIDPLWTVMHEGGPIHANFKMMERYLTWLEKENRGEMAQEIRAKYEDEFKYFMRKTK